MWQLWLGRLAVVVGGWVVASLTWGLVRPWVPPGSVSHLTIIAIYIFVILGCWQVWPRSKTKPPVSKEPGA